MRTFIAVQIPEWARKKVTAFIDGQRKKTLPIKWVQCENLHITLKFLGEIDENMKDTVAAVLQEVCQRHDGFEVGFSGIGCFPDRRRPRVLWVGIRQGADQLSAIARDLDERLEPLGFKKEKRFHSHLTIGRIRKPCSVDEIVDSEFGTGPCPVGSVTLFRSTLSSQGAQYSPLSTCGLAG